MAVACQLMIPARASGVVYTYDPVRPEQETMVISSAWGLGEPIVSGEVPTDTFILNRQPPHEIRETRIVRKDESMVLRGCGGLAIDGVAEEQRSEPSLTTSQLRDLARAGMRLEKYFKRPQDIEFAIDPQDRVVILQSRQLRLQQAGAPRACDLSGLAAKYNLLLRGRGTAAMEGIATRPGMGLSGGRFS